MNGNCEARPTRSRKPIVVNALRFDLLALQFGAFVETVHPPRVVMADGTLYELDVAS